MDAFPIPYSLSLRLLLGSPLPLAHHPQGKSLPSTRHILVHVVIASIAMHLPPARLTKGKSLPTIRHMLVHVMDGFLAIRLPPARLTKGIFLPQYSTYVCS